MTNRNYDDQEYRNFRRAVRNRDGHKCKMCSSTSRLHVHLIIPWSKSYELRFVVDNGITLCHDCHKMITKNETHWISYLSSLI